MFSYYLYSPHSCNYIKRSSNKIFILFEFIHGPPFHMGGVHISRKNLGHMMIQIYSLFQWFKWTTLLKKDRFHSIRSCTKKYLESYWELHFTIPKVTSILVKIPWPTPYVVQSNLYWRCHIRVWKIQIHTVLREF